MAHGGRCQDESCRVPASRPGRWANFFPVQANVIALAIGESKTAAICCAPLGGRAGRAYCWTSLGKAFNDGFEEPRELAASGARFAITLRSAKSVGASVRQASGSSEAFTIRLNAEFQNAARRGTGSGFIFRRACSGLSLRKRDRSRIRRFDRGGHGGSFQVVDKR